MFGRKPPTAEKTATKLLRALTRESRWDFLSSEDYESLDATKAILSASPEIRVAFIRIVIDKIGTLREKADIHSVQYQWMSGVKGFPRAGAFVIGRLLRRKQPFTEDDILFLIDRTAHLEIITARGLRYLIGLIQAVERHVRSNGLSDCLDSAVARLADALISDQYAAERKLRTRLTDLRGESGGVPLNRGEAWSDAVITDIEESPEIGSAWYDLLCHCRGASGGKPGKAWSERASEVVDAVGRDRLHDCALRWFPLVDEPRTQRLEPMWEQAPDQNILIDESHADVLKGLVWCCSLYEDAAIAGALSALAISSYKKVPLIGPRLVRVGNACVWSLGQMSGRDGVGQLAFLMVRVKFGTARNAIEKALTSAAARIGLPREELDEISVPTYGLTEVGVRREVLGDFTAELVVADGASVRLGWVKADGKTQKSIPAAVRRDHPDEVKELKQAVKDIQKMLPAQRERIDQLYLGRRSWTYPQWRERYLDHALVGTIVRRLIWEFRRGGRSAEGIFRDGSIVNLRGEAIPWLDDKTTVQLWHPIGKDTDDVVAWRRWIETNRVRQPFKQAHREVYLLTDAERTTRVYSNRFAAHILKQHQFNALCAARGWKNKLRLMVDDFSPPASLKLPQWNLRAEFWIDSVGDEYGVDTNENSTFYLVSTDQVRFYLSGADQCVSHACGGGYGERSTDGTNDPECIEAVPPLVFSEVMRDVDLFVGVASVGNDPVWADGGRDETQRSYWNDYAFGALRESAKTRKLVLENLIPRLKIAERCSFADKFLVVRGDLRSYKIHLGSGNILMAPNDEYLCIVQGRGAATGATADKVFLPFEGDRTLAAILSKAFLLAEDAKIDDPTIVSQIGRRVRGL